jgi:hypothetical protein
MVVQKAIDRGCFKKGVKKRLQEGNDDERISC